MALGKVLSSLKTAVGDLTSLSVETYTGEVVAEIKGAKDSAGVIDWTKLITEAKKDAGGKVALKLASHFNIDGDATLFVAQGEIPADLRLAHESAVAAGQKVRADLMELMSDAINKL